MDFRAILIEALERCKEDSKEPQMLYNMLCDIARNDYELEGQIESFYYLDKNFHLVKNISMQPEPRIIGRLLADCESQSEISSKVCLRWIYTVFEFYYRLAHTRWNGVGKALNALETDLFEEEQEGLRLPNKGKEKSADINKKGGESAPPSPASNPARSVKAYQAKQSKPIMVEAVNGGAPLFKGLKAYKKFAIPGAVYTSFPDDAVVYMGESPVLHTTNKCSSLKNAPVVYKGDYKSARKNDFFRVYQCYDNFLIEHHPTPCCSRCYDFELELLGANEAGKRKKTYQYQPISPPPPKTYQLSPRYRYLGRPTVSLVNLGGQIKLTPARGANAPRIEGLQCFNLVAPPNAIYKTFPDDAVVYLGGSSPNIHVSSQCPSIKYAFEIYRASYDQARYEDFFRMYKFCDANLARHHIPPVCATCGSFVPDIEGVTRKVEDL